MIRIEDFLQLKAFARQDGALLGLLWLASFSTFILMPGNAMSSFLALASPFFVLWRLVKFRNYALDKVISYRRALAYSCYTFFYGSVLFAFAQWLYFRFLDHGRFLEIISSLFNMVIPVYKANGINVNELKQSLDLIGQLNAIELAFQIMMTNILIGFLASVIIAVIGKRKR